MKSNTTTITMTQPPSWKAAWKAHMKATGRKNLSAFVGNAVNVFIENECAESNRKMAAISERGKKGGGNRKIVKPKAKKKVTA